MKLTEIIGNRYFQIFGVPMVFMLIGVFAKRLGRRDGDQAPRRNDWAVATTILLMTFGVIAADLRLASAASLPELAGWLVGMVFVTLISIDHDRYRSWQKVGGLASDRKNMFSGIILPDVVAVLVFSAYQYGKIS
jgi:hypothetical protein